ncbi:MAG TPA: hypothetical protein VJU86_19615 [Pyrinomonadaceae bacterium]|nr:hypothetical protein [Pyrinomonadaceae bacterium]
MKLFRTILRFVIAFLVITYGFAKLNGSQFTILDSELDKPMGQVSGFWLTWYYFGYSKFYGNIIALVQVLGGILLMFRRTTLLACCLLLPLIGNIILIDVFYAVDLGALLVAVFIEVGLLIIVAPHLRALRELFWTRRKDVEPSTSSGVITVGKHAARLLVILVPALFTYWVANYNNRLPTPIDGTWDVVNSSAQSQPPVGPNVIFFERNRAHLCVFKHPNGSYDWHHFEVNPETQTITIWKYWLQKGPKMFDGRYEISGPSLLLKGRQANHDEDSVITLKRQGG